jgi:hypothetical protein
MRRRRVQHGWRADPKDSHHRHYPGLSGRLPAHASVKFSAAQVEAAAIWRTGPAGGELAKSNATNLTEQHTQRGTNADFEPNIGRFVPLLGDSRIDGKVTLNER